MDPDTGKTTKVTLDPRVLRTKEARADWAVRKSKSLAKRRLELEAGAPRATGTALDAAIDRFFDDHPKLRPRTREIYRGAAHKLKRWAAVVGVRSGDDLTGAKLVAFKAQLVREPKRVKANGGRRGAMKPTSELRAPNSVNIELRAVRTILGYARQLGLLARVSSDDLKDGLKRLGVDHERPTYLKPPELRQLLAAALKHDEACFAETRAEHAGLRPLGSTQRYQMIAPLVAVVLLGGFRFSEAHSLTWKQIDLSTVDHDGAVVGTIFLGSETKTHRARDVDLGVSPGLRRLLEAMKEGAGDSARLFGQTHETVKSTVRRLRAEFGAPAAFSWQILRRTCETFLANSPGIYGAASVFRAARQVGHSVQVAERHYLGLERVSPAARTIEAALQVEPELERIIEAARARAGTSE